MYDQAARHAVLSEKRACGGAGPAGRASGKKSPYFAITGSVRLVTFNHYFNMGRTGTDLSALHKETLMRPSLYSAFKNIKPVFRNTLRFQIIIGIAGAGPSTRTDDHDIGR